MAVRAAAVEPRAHTLCWAGVGNVEGRLVRAAPGPAAELLLATDGLSRRFADDLVPRGSCDEIARELIGARRCIARLSVNGGPPLHAVAAAEGEESPATDGRDLDLLYEAIAPPGGALRMSGSELPTHQAIAEPVRGWLAASLTALSGEDIGLVQLLDKQDGDFTELDEAVLVQLAQMASAAIERAQLYRR